MSIKIPISAQFDAADTKKQIQIINDQIKNLANAVSVASNKKFEPITLKSKEDLQAFINQTQKLLKIQTELNQKLQQSGQAGKNPFLSDWTKMYGDKAQRIEKMRNALQFMGVGFNDNPKPPPPAAPRPGGGNGGGNGGGGNGGGGANNRQNMPSWLSGGWGQQGVNVLNSGLNAMGPVGGVFSNAMRSGMSGGAGAGLMGLVGGLAALGVGKLIGAIADKIDKAQDAAIGFDKIYRQIGGIASYSAIKYGVYGASNRLGMDVGEGIQLAQQYSRAANLREGDSLKEGMLLSGGLARTYGIEPGSVAGVMGGLRGANISRGDQDSRRIGLIIGETIAKSNAFAKADEIIQAVGQYAIAQARQSLSQPNIGAYGGAMASLMSANIPGLDAAGSSALLSRVNSALMQGGAGGAASQFLTSRVGQSMGLSPFQLRVLQEGGMFGTANSMFGQGSMYGRTHKGGPTGDTSFFEATRNQLRKNYGAGSDDYYLALSQHMGISVNQAMALDQMSPQNVNGASSRLRRLGLDLSKMNAQGIGTIGKIEGGKNLKDIAAGFLRQSGPNALSSSEKRQLAEAMSGGDVEKQKDVLSQIAYKHGSEATEGSQIRDSVAELNNSFTSYADKALPYLNTMRMALLKLSGTTENSLRESFAKDQREEKWSTASQMYTPKIKAAQDEIDKLHDQGVGLQTSTDDPRRKRLDALMKQKAIWQGQLDTEQQSATSEYNDIVNGTTSLSEDQQAKIRSRKIQPNQYSAMDKYDKYFQAASAKYGIPVNRLKAIAMTESGMNPNARSHAGARGLMQVMPQNFYEGEDPNDVATNIMVGARVLSNFEAKYGKGTDESLRGYNGGNRRGSLENREYAAKVRNNEDQIAGNQQEYAAKTESDAVAKSGDQVVRVEGQANVTLQHPDGQTQTEQVPLVQGKQFKRPNSYEARP
ncbi:lytic transglycosylase domain-containing protein [Salmonella enterica subsp. enterica serovar Typhimurium]|nr:lytic transglycosylase domain-containing protein [Salmonella enterica subsp. enterica serovar Typhimurium]